MEETAQRKFAPKKVSTLGESYSSDDKGPHHPDRQQRKLKDAHNYGRLSTRGGNFGIPNNAGARDHVEEHHGKESWRMRILEFLHQSKIQYILMGLLLLDVIVLFIELFLMTQYPPCHILERDCISCCPNNRNYTELEEHLRFLAEEEHHEDVCEEGLNPNLETGGCNTHKWDGVHKAEDGLFWVTVFILGTFFIELNLEMVSLHPGIFFRQFFYALDYFIVLISLVLELTLKSIDEESLATVVGLLIFARIWRFIRIGHGIVEVTSEMTHQKYEKLLEYAIEVEEAAKTEHVKLPPCPRSVAKALKQHSPSLHHDHDSSIPDL